jgi:hypothetical protein
MGLTPRHGTRLIIRSVAYPGSKSRDRRKAVAGPGFSLAPRAYWGYRLPHRAGLDKIDVVDGFNARSEMDEAELPQSMQFGWLIRYHARKEFSELLQPTPKEVRPRRTPRKTKRSSLPQLRKKRGGGSRARLPRLRFSSGGGPVLDIVLSFRVSASEHRQADEQIKALLAMPRLRGDRIEAREALDEGFDEWGGACTVRDDEIEGYGSTARWAGPTLGEACM